MTCIFTTAGYAPALLRDLRACTCTRFTIAGHALALLRDLRGLYIYVFPRARDRKLYNQKGWGRCGALTSIVIRGFVPNGVKLYRSQIFNGDGHDMRMLIRRLRGLRVFERVFYVDCKFLSELSTGIASF
jgi:hypothetical protein